MKSITIAVDAMGGDHGLDTVVPACVRAINKHQQLHLILTGDKQAIQKKLAKLGTSVSKRLSIVHTTEVVGMDELPSSAMRSKKNSSMRVAIDLVKDEKAQACVSAGNTGALMATSRFVLKTLPGIDRPAIISELPTLQNKTRVIDLGANVDSCAEHLFQFAVMGSALVKAVDKKNHPSIGVLNIGVEEIKGNDQVKRTAHMLSECPIMNYAGYVEGDHFYTGQVDLIVCDGFVGNVALKASEGLAKLMEGLVKEAINANPFIKLCSFFAYPALKRVKSKLDTSQYNGATLLGLNGIVIKSHGGANAAAFVHAIEEAMIEVEHQVVDLVRDQITDFMNQGLLL